MEDFSFREILQYVSEVLTTSTESLKELFIDPSLKKIFQVNDLNQPRLIKNFLTLQYRIARKKKYHLNYSREAALLVQEIEYLLVATNPQNQKKLFEVANLFSKKIRVKEDKATL